MQILAVENRFIVKLNSTLTNDLKRKIFFSKNVNSYRLSHFKKNLEGHRHNFEISTCDPLKHKMDYSILIVSICLGKSIRMKRVKLLMSFNFSHSIFPVESHILKYLCLMQSQSFHVC